MFVPEVGSTVFDAKKDVDLKAPDRIVYNIPETVAAFWTPERKKRFPDGLPEGAEPPKTGTPAGYEFIPHSKQYPAKQLARVRVIADVMEVGYLADDGEFAPYYDLPVLSRKKLMVDKPDPNIDFRYYTLPRPIGHTATEEVYEYRSGRLIKGTLHKTGNFVPELGSKVLDFKDYNPNGRRIYNLPGVLRKIK